MVQNGAKGAKFNTYSGYLYNTLFGQNTEAAIFRKAGKFRFNQNSST
jgi:hypothetical protein